MTGDAPRSLDEALDLAADAYLAGLDERDTPPAAEPQPA